MMMPETLLNKTASFPEFHPGTYDLDVQYINITLFFGISRDKFETSLTSLYDFPGAARRSPNKCVKRCGSDCTKSMQIRAVYCNGNKGIWGL